MVLHKYLDHDGSDVEVRWTGIATPSARDGRGLYRASDHDERQFRARWYVSCSWLPLTPRSSGWCWMPLPGDLTAGTYNVRLLADDGYTVLADSPPLTIGAP